MLFEVSIWIKLQSMLFFNIQQNIYKIHYTSKVNFLLDINLYNLILLLFLCKNYTWIITQVKLSKSVICTINFRVYSTHSTISVQGISGSFFYSN